MNWSRWAQAAVLFLLSVYASGSPAQTLERESPPCEPALQNEAINGAERGDAKQVYLLARYLSTGKCMPGDGKRAFNLYLRAADDQYPPAFYNLGMIAAANGDFRSAEGYLFKGTSLGHRGCELQLGILYGFAPPPVGDKRKAYAWLSLTASRDEVISDEAKGILAKIGTQLSADEKGQAEKLSSKLRADFGNVVPYLP